MDRKTWSSEIDKLDIWPDLKLKIMTLMSITENDLQFYKIKNPKVKDAFVNIKSYKNVYIVFDIEFQTSIIDKKSNYKIDSSPRGDIIASFPREFGMMVFVRDKLNDVYYLGSTHINFRSLTEFGFNKNDLKYMLSTYTTVSDSTLERMAKNDRIFKLENELNELKDGNYDALLESEVFGLESDAIQSKIVDIINELKDVDPYDDDEKQRKISIINRSLQRVAFAVYGRYLTKTKPAYDDQFKAYYSDQLVKSRMLGKKQELQFVTAFLDISHDTCFIVKGLRDLDAMSNIGTLLNIEKPLDINHIYDIEIFNGFSKMKYGSAQLEATYNGVISSSIYKKNNEDLNEIVTTIIGSAHNPLMDSYYTLVVALVMNMGLNEYFPADGISGGKLYMKLYQKEKQRYLKAKRKLTV